MWSLRGCGSPHKFSPMPPASPSTLRGAHNHGCTTPTNDEYPNRLLGVSENCAILRCAPRARRVALGSSSVAEPNTFSGAALDRAEDGRRRDEAWLAQQAAHPAARAVVLSDAGVRMDGQALARVELSRLETDRMTVFLGLDDTGPVFAVDCGPVPEPGRRPGFLGAGGRRGEPAPEQAGHLGLRDAAQTLSQEDGGLAAYAAAILNWHRSHRFCPNCASETEIGEAGVVRGCPRCGLQHHPRTDPVVIMLVEDGDRALLGRQRVWPRRRYSTLAGFVAPGESLEEAVAREVFEEVGVTVGLPDYRSSQPWPFPASLMLGFTVPYVGGELGGTDKELDDARWFSRDEVAEAARENSWTEPDEGDGLLLPPRSAIARRLIEDWLA